MLLRDVVGVALFAMVVGCGASSTASRPESSPVATVEQDLVDRFHRVMPQSPTDLRTPTVRQQFAPAALPLLREVHAFVQAHPNSHLAARSDEFTIYALLLGDAPLRERLQLQAGAGDASARLLLDSCAAIAADAVAPRASAIAAVAAGLRAASPAPREGVLQSASFCLIAAAELTEAEAAMLASSAIEPAVAKQFEAASQRAAKDPRRLLDQAIELRGNLVARTAFSTASLRGKVVLVDFWATWCGPCVRGLPAIAGLRDKYGKQGLAVVGISNDRDKGELEAFLRAHPEYDWPQLFEPDVDGFHPLAAEYGIDAIPRLFLIDRQGVLRNVDAHEHLEERIVRLLAQ